ncbi:hypothetical protein FKP32DRAFT_1430049 [Trametes sanguinea]|nr:hypothetical protein FKP32DRAFT_1430049 [Trametes sanguinea]
MPGPSPTSSTPSITPHSRPPRPSPARPGSTPVAAALSRATLSPSAYDGRRGHHYRTEAIRRNGSRLTRRRRGGTNTEKYSDATRTEQPPEATTAGFEPSRCGAALFLPSPTALARAEPRVPRGGVHGRVHRVRYVPRIRTAESGWRGHGGVPVRNAYKPRYASARRRLVILPGRRTLPVR